MLSSAQLLRRSALGVGIGLLAASMATTAATAQTPGTTTTPTVYQVKNVNIGAMPVKTIVPITASSSEAALTQARTIASNPDVDMAEFRIDLLDFADDTDRVIALGHQLNAILKDKPLIATIRTHNEGGQMEVTDNQYAEIYSQYLSNPFMQLLDIEMFRDTTIVKNLTQLAHEQDVLIIMSNHDFDKTPPQQEIVKRLLQQDALGADILKIAVMPQSKKDVLTLMNATLEVSERSSKPLLTMSMSQLGTISRIATANMGGSMSFGMIGEASAPGQIDVTNLKGILQTVQPTK